MTAQHTPGPWTAEDNSWEVSTVYSATGNQIAKCYIDAETEEDTQEKFEPIKEANARLIAAAPDLLASLSEMVAMMDSGDEHGAGSEWHTKASAAIARATGGAK